MRFHLEPVFRRVGWLGMDAFCRNTLPIFVLAMGLLAGCEGSGASTSIGFGGGSGIGIGSQGYRASGGYGGGFGLVFPSSSGAASSPFVADQEIVDVTVQHALEFKPIGEAASWSNPNTGNSGTATPVRAYQNAEGQSCREFQQTASNGAATSSSACRDTSGVWHMGTG